jgi:hypothetical protein
MSVRVKQSTVMICQCVVLPPLHTNFPFFTPPYQAFLQLASQSEEVQVILITVILILKVTSLLLVRSSKQIKTK